MSLAEEITEPQGNAPIEVGPQLDGRYQIDLSARLDFLDKGQNQAYKAIDVKNPTVELFAMISNPFVPYRLDYAEAMKVSHIPGITEFLAHGPVRFGDMDIRYVFVFKMPVGGLVFNRSDGPMDERVILNKIVPQLIEALKALEKLNIPHRGIRADNLFYEDIAQSNVVLGESITTPAGSDQIAVYEPIESANAHAFGRGAGNISSDIYAMGVLIVHLLSGRLPQDNVSLEQIFVSKLEMGSYALLTSDLSLSSRMQLLLKGLLHDDPARRWDMEQFSKWREIMHDRAKVGAGDRQVPGAIFVAGHEYDSPKLLANALAGVPKEACELLKSGKLENWVKNSLRDNDTAERLAEIQFSSRNNSRGQSKTELTATAQIATLLSPTCAIRYRDLAFSKDGLPSLLAFAFQSDDATMKASIGELLESGVLVELLAEGIGEQGPRRTGALLLSKMADCMEYMKSKDRFGFGLERCFYELNPTAACLSPSLLGSHVTTMSQFMKVVEKKLTTPGNQVNPFDRHCAAFIAAKASGQGKSFRQIALGKPGSIEHSAGLLNMFGRLQNVYHPGPLPGFCIWADSQLKPLIANLKSELRREFVMKRFEVGRKSGNIGTILLATDIQRHTRKDEKEFHQARSNFAGAEQLAVRLESAIEERKAAATQYGNWIASVLSITALLTSMGLSALHFMG
ncbi:hypothetical protein NBZ79_06970 [Sneathiella marina]|uniref:non-specific serine/threonine protein kinase n=1 Tax=Sneathiella marina TaxID=2950108 RepID=A0ABY4W9Y8_9PROT|nr:hypothetical protein [Sneathiella marina]USG62717.1 hypothetical protein NBZ79_06970 [Sneathiella marina]